MRPLTGSSRQRAEARGLGSGGPALRTAGGTEGGRRHGGRAATRRAGGDTEGGRRHGRRAATRRWAATRPALRRAGDGEERPATCGAGDMAGRPATWRGGWRHGGAAGDMAGRLATWRGGRRHGGAVGDMAGRLATWRGGRRHGGRPATWRRRARRVATSLPGAQNVAPATPRRSLPGAHSGYRRENGTKYGRFRDENYSLHPEGAYPLRNGRLSCQLTTGHRADPGQTVPLRPRGAAKTGSRRETKFNVGARWRTLRQTAVNRAGLVLSFVRRTSCVGLDAAA